MRYSTGRDRPRCTASTLSSWGSCCQGAEGAELDCCSL